jgi:DNA-directed RNA polymerase subunit RPC12/RpoP
MKMIVLKCPECHASLDIEEGRKQVFCSYCGAKIIVENENEHIYRHIDEAQIKRAESDGIVQMRKLELAEKKRAAREKTKSLKIKISITLGVIMIGSLVFGYAGDSGYGLTSASMMVGMVCAIALMMMWMNNINNNDSEDDFDEKVKVPSLSDYENQSYMAIEAKFRSSGFTNIKCVPLNDLKVGLLKKPNMVESITINGHNTTSGGKKYLPDANVVIAYHSLA